MPISDYLGRLREKIGHDLVFVPSVTALVLDDRRRLLLLRHSNGDVWVAPGGAVDPDERPADAVVREVREEAGLDVEPVGIRGVLGGPEFRVRYANGDEVAYVMTVYACRVTGGRLRPDGGEVLEARWVGSEEWTALRVPAWGRIVVPLAWADR